MVCELIQELVSGTSLTKHRNIHDASTVIGINVAEWKHSHNSSQNHRRLQDTQSKMTQSQGPILCRDIAKDS